MVIRVKVTDNPVITVLEGDYTKAKQEFAPICANFEKDVDYSNIDLNNYLSDLQLLDFHLGQKDVSYPFADKLLEYLTGLAITPNDPISQNIIDAKIKFNSKFKLPVIPVNGKFTANDRLRCLDLFGRSKYWNKSTYDLLGYVDKEIEEMLYTALKGFFSDENITLEQFTSTLDNPNGIISSDKVGASIASDIKRNAVISVIIALLVIFAYIAWRFKGWAWGLGGVVSLAHTAIIIIGFFSLFTGILPFNLDVDQTFIAAILTIIGYAINDNVVIFDRIRENLSLHPNADFKDTVNQAVNATLTRTVNTSVSTLLPMLAIAIFGGESIRGLSVALCLGICIGTYASIMIGTPIMADLSLKAAKKAVKK